MILIVLEDTDRPGYQDYEKYDRISDKMSRNSWKASKFQIACTPDQNVLQAQPLTAPVANCPKQVYPHD